MTGLAVHRQRGEEVEDLLRQQMQATQQVRESHWFHKWYILLPGFVSSQQRG